MTKEKLFKLGLSDVSDMHYPERLTDSRNHCLGF